MAARMAVVPYIMPGFALAKKAAEIYEADPDGRGPGAARSTASSPSATSAREAYERMIEMVTRAEERLARRRNAVFVPRALPQRCAASREVAPILRGACSARTEPAKARGGAWCWSSAAAPRCSTLSTAPSSRAMPTPAW